MQPGDQVSFELVSPRRLVIQIISTEEAGPGGATGGGAAVQSNSNATSPIQEDNPNSSPRDRDLNAVVRPLCQKTVIVIDMEQ